MRTRLIMMLVGLAVVASVLAPAAVASGPGPELAAGEPASITPNPRVRYGTIVTPNPIRWGSIVSPNPRHWNGTIVVPNPRSWGRVSPNPRFYGTIVMPNPRMFDRITLSPRPRSRI